MKTHLSKIDPAVSKLVAQEDKRQEATLDLIPSENIVSEAVLEALGSRLANKYSEGYAGKRYYAGNTVVDFVERLAIERAKKVFRLGKEWDVNVQALSGSPANMAVYFSLLKPGDTVMGMALSSGGHLTHGSPANFSGKLFKIVSYDVDKNGLLDYAAVAKIAEKEKPKMIIGGATAYSRIIDFKRLGEISRSVKAFFMVDMAHIAGLVAAGVHPSPFPHADVVTTTTHKTLRGPRGALIFSRNDRTIEVQGKEMGLSRLIDRTVFPGLQGGPHDNQTAAIAVALGEAMKPPFKTYARQIVKNSRALAGELTRLGSHVITGGSDNHLILIDVTKFGVSGREAQDRLEAIGVIVNRNTIPHDIRSPFDPSGIRIGTPTLTTRGMKEREMKKVAAIIVGALRDRKQSELAKDVLALAKKFPIRRNP